MIMSASCVVGDLYSISINQNFVNREWQKKMMLLIGLNFCMYTD